jgi:hypothetical protein
MEKFSNSLLWNFDEPQEKRKLSSSLKSTEKMGRKTFQVLEKNTNPNSIMIIVFPYHFEIKENCLMEMEKLFKVIKNNLVKKGFLIFSG